MLLLYSTTQVKENWTLTTSSSSSSFFFFLSNLLLFCIYLLLFYCVATIFFPSHFWQLGCHNFFFSPLIFGNSFSATWLPQILLFSPTISATWLPQSFFLSLHSPWISTTWLAQLVFSFRTLLLRTLHQFGQSNSGRRNFSNLITKIQFFSHSHITSFLSPLSSFFC